MGDYTMPSLGADMEAGTIVEWLVRPGDAVHHGDIVARIDTEKATIDAEVFEDGVVTDLLVGAGERVAVGTALARIAPAESRAPAVTARPARARRRRAAAARAGTPAEATHGAAAPARAPVPTYSPLVRHLAERSGVALGALRGSGPAGTATRADVEAAAQARATAPAHVRAAPRARQRAEELGVDLSALRGSGPEGVITVADVERAGAAVPAPPAAPPAESTAPAAATVDERQGALRHRIATLMTRAKREIPHYYLETTIDLAVAQAWVTAENATRTPDRRLLPIALMLKATAVAALAVPEMNGYFVDDEFRPSPTVHLGVAVSLRSGGLIAPALHSVETLPLDAVMAQLKDLVARTRAGRLRSSEMADPTLTVTNLGDQGVDTVLGVIYPPQVALVGIGKITERPVALSGMLGVHPLVTFTLAADHRVSDGMRGARFLAKIDQLLQRPEAL